MLKAYKVSVNEKHQSLLNEIVRNSLSEEREFIDNQIAYNEIIVKVQEKQREEYYQTAMDFINRLGFNYERDILFLNEMIDLSISNFISNHTPFKVTSPSYKIPTTDAEVAITNIFNQTVKRLSPVYYYGLLTVYFDANEIDDAVTNIITLKVVEAISSFNLGKK
jgi:hypothetical protein